MGQYAIPIGRAGGLLCGDHPRKKRGWDLLIGVQAKIFFIHWIPTRKKTDLIGAIALLRWRGNIEETVWMPNSSTYAECR